MSHSSLPWNISSAIRVVSTAATQKSPLAPFPTLLFANFPRKLLQGWPVPSPLPTSAQLFTKETHLAFLGLLQSSFILSSNWKPGSKASLERKGEAANFYYTRLSLLILYSYSILSIEHNVWDIIWYTILSIPDVSHGVSHLQTNQRLNSWGHGPMDQWQFSDASHRNHWLITCG